MRKLLVLLLFVLLLVACSNGDDSGTTNNVSDEAEPDIETETDNDDNDEADDTGEADDTEEATTEDSGEYVTDITEVTGDDRFIPLGGTILEMVELDQEIINNDVLKMDAVRALVFEEGHYVYQIELELKKEDTPTVSIINAEVNGVEVTHATAIDYGQTFYVEEAGPHFVTILYHDFEGEFTDLKEVTYNIEVSKTEAYEIHGEFEIVLDFQWAL